MKAEGAKMGINMMAEMMRNMMQSMMKEGEGMPEMCLKMMEQMWSTTESARIGYYATPEIIGLFEDWLKNLEKELIEFVKEKGKTTPSEISEKLKISKESVVFLIAKLAREGKLEIGEVREGKGI
jgi:predicted HTH transcriptional regulator